jgi:hypothetical protein
MPSLDLGLTWYEHMLPTWKTEYGLEPPPAAPFDLEAAIKRLRKCCYPNGYIHSPENAGIPVRMTPEEAWFWLRAMSRGFFQADKFKGKNAVKVPTGKQVRELLSGSINNSDNCPGMRSVMSASWYPELVSAVLVLVKTEEVFGFIAENVEAFEMSALSQYNHRFGNFLAGCCMFMTPFLSRDECERMGAKYVRELKADPDMKKPQGIAALAILAVLGDADTVTRTLRKTKAKIHPYSHWLFARTDSLESYNELMTRHKQAFNEVESAKILLAVKGTDVSGDLESCISGLKPHQKRVMKVFERVQHPGIAPVMLAQRSHHKEAAAWLRKNPLLAAAGLARYATGADALTPAARSFWTELWQNEPEVARQALEWAPGASRSLLEKLSAASDLRREPITEAKWPAELLEALETLPQRQPPDWLRLSVLPALLIQGQPLPPEEVRRLIQGWKRVSDEKVPAWFVTLKRHACAESLNAFSEALFEQWRLEGCPAADVWVLLAAALGGNEHFHVRFSRYLAYKPLNSPWPHVRACAGVRALAAAGSPSAISQLYRLAHATYESMQKAEAQKRLSQLAEERGISVEDLADECVPDACFDLQGRRVFSCGEHRFEAQLDEGHELRFLQPDGQTRRQLPAKARKLPRESYLALCRQIRHARRLLRDTLDVQLTRLRLAFSQDFQRPVERFQSRVLQHPVLSRLARQIIWQMIPEKSNPIAFRPVEDGSLVTAHNGPFTLPIRGAVRLASPAHLSEDESRTWIEHLADHHIIQPVKQFANSACLPLPAELGLLKLNRFIGGVMTAGSMMRAFADEHWSHDKPQGGFTRHFRAFPSGKLFACVRHTLVWFDPLGRAEENLAERPVEIEDVWFIPDHIPKKEWRNSKHYLAIRDVPPAIFSEVFSLLHRMTGVPVPETIT